MAATIALVESNKYLARTTQLSANLESYAYKLEDSPVSVDVNDAVIHCLWKPYNGYLWSHVKWWRFTCTDLGGSSQVDTFKVWWTGTLPTGVEIYVTQGGTYEVLEPYHTHDSSWLPTISGSPSPSSLTNVTTYPSEGSALSVSGTLTAAGTYTSYIAHVMRVAYSLSEALTLDGSVAFNYSYSES